MRITCVIPTLFCGGAERVMTILANQWATQKQTITILTFDDGTLPPFYELHPNVQHISLALARESGQVFAALRNNFRLLRRLRQAINTTAPDVVVSFLVRTNIRTLFACYGLGLPVIVAERADPARRDVGHIWRGLRRLTYKMAAQIVAYSPSCAQYFVAWRTNGVRVIPNPVIVTATKKKSSDENLLRVVSVGRLVTQKGYDVLLHAFAKVQMQLPAATLTIWGEGNQRGALETLREQLNLQAQVILPGVTKDVAQVLAAADVFVCASRSEGFANALCEAMAYGLPVIATDCLGARAVVQSGVNGILVPIDEPDALAAAMIEMLSDSALRKNLAARATEIRAEFQLENVMQQWHELLCAVVPQA